MVVVARRRCKARTITVEHLIQLRVPIHTHFTQTCPEAGTGPDADPQGVPFGKAGSNCSCHRSGCGYTCLVLVPTLGKV